MYQPKSTAIIGRQRSFDRIPGRFARICGVGSATPHHKCTGRHWPPDPPLPCTGTAHAGTKEHCYQRSSHPDQGCFIDNISPPMSLRRSRSCSSSRLGIHFPRRNRRNVPFKTPHQTTRRYLARNHGVWHWLVELTPRSRSFRTERGVCTPTTATATRWLHLLRPVALRTLSCPFSALATPAVNCKSRLECVMSASHGSDYTHRGGYPSRRRRHPPFHCHDGGAATRHRTECM